MGSKIKKYKSLFNYFLVVLFVLGGCAMGFAQQSLTQVKAKFIDQPITVDGVLDEDIWQEISPVSDFWQYFPADSIKAEYQTSIQIAYDQSNLYVAFRAEARDNNFVVSSLKRDFSGLGNDNVTVMFDTFNDGTNAFGFGITPYGVRREFLVSQEGRL